MNSSPGNNFSKILCSPVVCLSGFLIAFLFVYTYIFLSVPVEVYQGFSQKIMYIHVPTIMVSYLFYFLVFFASVGVLWKKSEGYDRLAVSACEIGTLFTGIALITGSIWGKPTWNTYWTWDAKLTITLISFLIYSGYSLFRTFSDFGEKQMISAAVIGILGFISIPLNHLSVTWWRTLHQPSTFFTEKDTISPELRNPLYYALILFLLFAFWLLARRMRLEKEKRQELKSIQQML